MPPQRLTLQFTSGEVVILGTEYAGEMKKSVFTILNYLLPPKNVMPMHCSVNVGKAKESAIFFGLSGTGKTTLSADPKRQLVGDDEQRGEQQRKGRCWAPATLARKIIDQQKRDSIDREQSDLKECAIADQRCQEA